MKCMIFNFCIGGRKTHFVYYFSKPSNYHLLGDLNILGRGKLFSLNLLKNIKKYRDKWDGQDLGATRCLVRTGQIQMGWGESRWIGAGRVKMPFLIMTDQQCKGEPK